MLYSFSFLQRQPRLAMVARDLSQRRLGLDLRPRLEHLAQHASPARAARRAVALRVVGHRRAGGGSLWRRRWSARDAHLQSTTQRMALDETEIAARAAQRRKNGLRRRAQGPRDVRLAIQ